MPPSPNVNNLSLLRGVVYIGRHVSGMLNGFDDVGEADKFDLAQPDISEVEQFTARDGTGGKVKGTVTKIVPKVEISGQELSTFNLALAALGLENAFNQSSGSRTDYSLIASVKVGKTYFLPDQSVSSLVVKKSPSTTLTLGDDYTANLTAGWIYIPPDGTLVDGDTVLVSYSYAALTRTAVSPASVKRIDASLRYVGASADGQIFDAKIWHLQIKPGGVLSMIQPPDANEYGRWSIQADVLTDAGGTYGGSADYPFSQVVEVGQVSS